MSLLTNPLQEPAPSNTKQEVVNYASGSTQNHRYPESRSWCWIHKTPSQSVEFYAKFLEMSVAEIFEAAKQAGACFKCLKTNRHIAKNCLNSSQCTVFEEGQICGKRHHPLFHRKLDSDTAVNQNNEVHNVLGNDDRPILAVNAIQCKNQLINVMWDSGANISLITRRATQRLGLKGKSTTLSIVKVGDDLTSLDSKEVEVPLEDLQGKIWTVQAYEIDEITANLNQVDTQQIQSHFPEINASTITKPEGKIDMLIGVDSCAQGWRSLSESVGVQTGWGPPHIGPTRYKGPENS